VAVGNKMIVFGGRGAVSNYTINSGGIFDADTQRWISINPPANIEDRRDHFSFWTGTQMIIWGGIYGDSGDNIVSNIDLYTP
jgi:hypothetical protein